MFFQKRWARFGLSFAVVVNINKMISVLELRLYKGRRSPVIIWLCLWFLQFASVKSLKIFHNLWNLSRRSFKIQKNRGYKGTFLAICNFCVFFLNFGLVIIFFLSTGTRKGTNKFNGPANLRKFYRRKREKSCAKYPYFLYRKTLRNEIELRPNL